MSYAQIENLIAQHPGPWQAANPNAGSAHIHDRHGKTVARISGADCDLLADFLAYLANGSDPMGDIAAFARLLERIVASAAEVASHEGKEISSLAASLDEMVGATVGNRNELDAGTRRVLFKRVIRWAYELLDGDEIERLKAENLRAQEAVKAAYEAAAHPQRPTLN